MASKTSAARTAAHEQRPIRVAIVDDHVLARIAMQTVVAMVQGFEVAFGAEHGEDYISKCKSHGAPDIAMVDLLMPVMDGWATIAWIREHQTNTRAVAITFDPVDEYVRRAWKVGANAVMPKAATVAQVRTALSDVSLTGFHRNELVQLRLVEKPAPEVERVKTTNERIGSLADRELETLIWLAHPEGFTAGAIALKMGVELSSVETWCRRIYRKLGVKNRGQAVAFALEHRLVVR